MYIDPNVQYLYIKRISLIILSIGVAVLGFGPPLLILLVYPTSLYRNISDRISPVWRIRIKIYAESFNKCFKDGTDGTRDYRSFSGWLLLLFGFFPQLLFALVKATMLTTNTTNAYILVLYFATMAFLCTLLHPYKENISNALTSGILLIESMLLAVAVGIIDNQEREAVKVIMTVLLLIPHCVFWGYIVCRLVSTVVRRCCRSSGATTYDESRRLLSISATITLQTITAEHNIHCIAAHIRYSVIHFSIIIILYIICIYYCDCLLYTFCTSITIKYKLQIIRVSYPIPLVFSV